MKDLKNGNHLPSIKLNKCFIMLYSQAPTISMSPASFGETPCIPQMPASAFRKVRQAGTTVYECTVTNCGKTFTRNAGNSKAHLGTYESFRCSITNLHRSCATTARWLSVASRTRSGTLSILNTKLCK
jgi:hypothetical protein